MQNKKSAVAFTWALYDFANTIYSMNVVSFYFPLWLTIDKGLPELAYSLFYSGAILVAALLSPLVGAFSDFWKSRKTPLILTTLVCVIFVFGIGKVTSPWMALSFFFVAHLAYVLSLVFYNSMLPQVSEHSTPARVCGLGVGIGYVGTIVGLLVATQFLAGPLGRQGIFFPTAVMFLIFALPLFIWGPNLKKEHAPLKTFSWRKIWNWKSHTPQMRWFLLALFLAGDAVHTVILFMSIYAKRVFGMSDHLITQFFILSTVTAIAASFFWGEFTSRKGGVRSLEIVLILWLATFLLGGFANQPWLYWVVGSFVGISLAGTWVAARVLVVELAPKERLGEYFGLYNLTGKSAAVLGPLVWSLLLILFSSLGTLKYRCALLSLTLFVAGGLFALKQVKKLTCHPERSEGSRL